LGEVSVPLPSLAEQQRLTDRLDAIETRLTRIRQLRDEQTQTLRAALRSSFHRLITSAEWKTLAEVAPLAWRKVEIESEATYTEFGVRSFYNGVFLRRRVLGAVFDWQELYRLRAGDIVFSNIMAWEKAIAVAGPEHDGWVGNHRMLICEPRREVISASCLLHYFMTEEGFGKILQASPGTAARNKTLKADRLMDIKVPVPPLAAQREFQKLLTLQAQVTARAAESDSAAIAILPSLLDQIFN
jgi:type I restriction enzyme S subunit